MGIFAKKNKTDNSYKNAQDFIQNAKQFIINENELIRNQNKFLKFFALMSLFVAFGGVLAVIFLTPLKKVEPYLIRVDNATGKADVITILNKKVESFGKVTDKYYIAQYVNYRESYDWNTVDSLYKATLLMSEENVQQEYKKIYGTSNNLSPVNKFKDRFKVTTSIEAIDFLGDVVQVRFTKTKIPLNNLLSQDKNISNDFLATLTYDYSNIPLTEKERFINPLGFKVVSYEVKKIK